ncbi:YqiA/YcfP family alpha/beta fold hydrolase [Methylocaldum sp. MU1018]
MIVYLHGFRSSPASAKARRLAERMAARGLADRFWCEQLPVGPRQAIERIERALAQSPTVPTLVGSSLGGYYATYLAEKHDLRAVLINPAADAPRTLAAFVGPQTNLYTGETFEFTSEHIAELDALAVPQLARPERFWLLVETGDEVLDYRQAVQKYAGARQTVIEGGDHSFRHFPDFLDAIVDFAEG